MSLKEALNTPEWRKMGQLCLWITLNTFNTIILFLLPHFIALLFNPNSARQLTYFFPMFYFITPWKKKGKKSNEKFYDFLSGYKNVTS